ncbi:hypothetical protein ACIHFE_31620 [Streptomyces sp. NPDC052396]|uniref:baeRF2 domain-containing protein n=1 Tax=Streptomyces sp. NPDC052396 TaxID=3365689 RepID=UPI0037CD659A
MKLDFLDAVYARQGPYACAYLDSSRDIDDPDRAMEVHRQHVCEDLARQGADAATMAVVAGVAGCDREISGMHGQAIIASHGRLILAEELPEPPVHDEAGFTALPDLMPLAVQHAPDIPYTAVTVHRVPHPHPHADAPEELEVVFQAGRWPMSTVAPGVCHRVRGSAAGWPSGAAHVAGDIAELARRSGAETIVLSGLTWARNVLANRLPKQWREHTVVSGGDGCRTEAGRALMERQLARVFQGRMSAADRARTEMFQAERARHQRAVEGLPAVVAALQRSQVNTLLLNTPALLPTPLHVGSQPTQIGLSGADLEPYGVLSFREGPAGAAVIRAVVRTGAQLVVVPQHELPLADGIGALLRYAGPEGGRE